MIDPDRIARPQHVVPGHADHVGLGIARGFPRLPIAPRRGGVLVIGRASVVYVVIGPLQRDGEGLTRFVEQGREVGGGNPDPVPVGGMARDGAVRGRPGEGTGGHGRHREVGDLAHPFLVEVDIGVAGEVEVGPQNGTPLAHRPVRVVIGEQERDEGRRRYGGHVRAAVGAEVDAVAVGTRLVAKRRAEIARVDAGRSGPEVEVARRGIDEHGIVQDGIDQGVADGMVVEVGFHLPVEKIDELLLPPHQHAGARGEVVVVVAVKPDLAVGGDVQAVAVFRPQDVIEQGDAGGTADHPHAIAGRGVDGVVNDGHGMVVVDQDALLGVLVEQVVVDGNAGGGGDAHQVLANHVVLHLRAAICGHPRAVVVDVVDLARGPTGAAQQPVTRQPGRVVVDVIVENPHRRAVIKDADVAVPDLVVVDVPVGGGMNAVGRAVDHPVAAHFAEGGVVP